MMLYSDVNMLKSMYMLEQLKTLRLQADMAEAALGRHHFTMHPVSFQPRPELTLPCPESLPLPTKLMSPSPSLACMPSFVGDLNRKCGEIMMGGMTTLAIHNIPNRYSQDALFVDFQGFSFDFLYLPYRLKQRRSSRYAFVNFSSPEEAARFCRKFDGLCISTSQVPLSVGIATTQGLAANLKLHISTVKANPKQKPIVFDNHMQRVDYENLAAEMMSTASSQSFEEHSSDSSPFSSCQTPNEGFHIQHFCL
ncbi:unnamed protein product [Polarella glacialis]|uniref:RRM domain-containing protein n=1 Tax=Polarella glacialis TaxID=89957 RepID=A0A813F9T8_POLGL|nr:unnamed protein product [Polarella glacialis]CAE8698936.1 unnamed protein product [Polarella glacialis]|mmetsp:Transcript_100101/g.180592  ORF Transcript_100101/g.180592 Transcript_100101/m.180592 type:complete len:252 (-) Transcript_100101:51-806(-)|eukprot:CAMPEP_0115079934 /NCGR_PEP_ID=MMETSP0227-20121206/18388_1 /TAXON_ID=89957 /ORGANISM="Polarella glacialis, Strain CCMP 1383" /LENGTH=251 /DNA_ID=CAMNT_0002467501 /DNA_START=28 /DNA_END=783 /DNA_ORIENTATION=+